MIELHALVCIFYRMVDHHFACSKSSSGQLNTAYVQYINGYLKTIFSFREEVSSRYLTIIKKNLAGRTSLNTHFVFLRVKGNSAKALFHNKSTQVLIVFYLSKYNKHICKSAIGDPHLLSIKSIRFTINRRHSLCFT